MIAELTFIVGTKTPVRSREDEVGERLTQASCVGRCVAGARDAATP
jgi:hypothetical protein